MGTGSSVFGRHGRHWFPIWVEWFKILLEVPMIHHEKKSAITPELDAEFQAAVRQAMSLKRDPEAMRRAAERMDRMREETCPLHGLLDIGVPAIRELGGELPERLSSGRPALARHQWFRYRKLSV
jgi:hypothetical protein